MSRLAAAARLGAAFGLGVAATLALGAASPYGGLERLARVLSQVEGDYERPLTLDALADAALTGLVGTLDENSRYFDAAAWSALRLAESGLEPLGVGATATAEPCGLRVTALEAWGAAETAGLREQDCITAIDGQPATAERLIGEPGSAVRLRVRRGDVESELAILRRPPKPPTLTAEPLEGGRLLVRVSQFHDRVAPRLITAVGDARKVTGLVLDLRQNPGGRVEEAVAVVDLFVAEGTVVTTRTRTRGDMVYSASAARTDWKFPVVVLIDGETASAAEIVAGALSDLGRARLVGDRTYGKGSVQQVYQYEDGSALRLTVGRYLLPKRGPLLDHEGLEPNIAVARSGRLDVRSPLATRLATDPQLAAAVAALSSP